MSPQDLQILLKAKRFSQLHNEKELQKEIESFFIGKNIPFEKEKHILGGGRKHIFDFYLDGIVMEVKLRAPKKQIYRQCKRYAELKECTSILLFSLSCTGFPIEIDAKPCYVVNPSGS